MERLRQMEDFSKGIITGTAYDKNQKKTTAHYSYTLENNGCAQAVRDLWPHQRKVDFRSDVPIVNPVQMTKVSLVPPKQNVVEYLAENSSARYTLKGVDLTTAALARSYTDPFKIPFATDFTTVNSKVASYLYQRALSRASSAEFDFGVTVGEIAETASFLAKPLASIVSLSNRAFRGISLVRNVGTKTAIRISKNASKKTLRRILETTTAANPADPALRFIDASANHWLAYKFGVLPILDDIAKLTKFKEENIKRQLGVRTARVKGYKSDTTSSLLTNGSVFYYFKYDLFRLKRVEDRHTFGLYFRNEITAPLANFCEGLGFAPFNIFSLAYELIPLSFVVDRFIDIKSFIKGNLGGLTKQNLAYYCSRKILTTYSASATNVSFGYPSKIPCKVSQDLRSTGTVEQLARVVNLDRPNFPVINPYWQKQLTADATNLSLIWGRLRTFVGKAK